MKKLKVIAILLAITTLTNVHAVLQSRDGVRVLNDLCVSDYFKKSREMEAEGGVLGLNATFAENATTGEYEETSDSNNIDAHLCKNTEWGAVAMLSASSYGAGNGNVKNGYDSKTATYDKTASTTGNMSGVFGMNSGAAEEEHVAAGIVSRMSISSHKYLKNAHIRYVDSYADSSDKSDFSTRYIPGDATYETIVLSGGGDFVVSSASIFTRGRYGIFRWANLSGSGHGIWGARVAMWVGEGL